MARSTDLSQDTRAQRDPSYSPTRDKYSPGDNAAESSRPTGESGPMDNSAMNTAERDVNHSEHMGHDYGGSE